MRLSVTLAVLCSLVFQLAGCLGPGQPGVFPTSAPITGGSGGGTTTSPVALDSEEQAFLGLINDYRLQNGAPALEISAVLTTSSKWMSADMAAKDYFSHTDSLGRDPFTRMAAFGYDTSGYSGENIAAGYASAQDTFTQWKNSPAHNANMLDASYHAIGVGRAYDAKSTYGWYWTTDFGSGLQ